MDSYHSFDSMKYLRRDFLDSQRLMILSVTKRCNLRCLYCRPNNSKWYDVLSQNAHHTDFQKENWNKLLDICQKFNIGEITLTGGEPLEYPLLSELLLFLNSHNIRFSVHTNGCSKNWPDLLDFLVRYNITLNVHLSTELFVKLQKDLRGTFLPINFIHKIVDNNMNVELKITLHKMLIPYLDKIQNNLYFWINTGIKSIRFQPIVPVGSKFPDGLELDCSFIPFLEELKWLKNNDHLLHKMIRNSPRSFEAVISLLNNSELPKGLVENCNIVDKILFINTDFKISNCKTLWGKKNDASCSDVFDMVCCGFQH